MSLKLSHEELNRHLIDTCAHIVRSVVKDPDLVEVTLDDRRDQMTVKVSHRDRGVVIGRGGQNLFAVESALQLALTYLDDQASVRKAGNGRPYGLPSIEVRAIDEA